MTGNNQPNTSPYIDTGEQCHYIPCESSAVTLTLPAVLPGVMEIEAGKTVRIINSGEVESLRQQNERFRLALEEIVNPIKFMRDRLKPGEQLNGPYAVLLSENAYQLKQIARKALEGGQDADNS